METIPFHRHWTDISDSLGLDIELSHTIEFGDTKLTVPVLLRGFGAPEGMLLVTDFDLIRNVADELLSLGYGYSRLSEPTPGPIDWGSVEEMLRDWGASN